MASSDICLLRAEGRDGKGKKKNHNCMFFGSGVKRLSRKIASKALGRTIWSQRLLGLLLACHKKRSGAVCSFPSSAPRNMGLLASRSFSRLSCFLAWKTPWKKKKIKVIAWSPSYNAVCSPAEVRPCQSPGVFVARSWHWPLSACALRNPSKVVSQPLSSNIAAHP